MGNSNFENIAQEILRQKRLMEALEAENKELRRQLTDLREARGIFIEICGNRFPLKAEEEHTSPQIPQISAVSQQDLSNKPEKDSAPSLPLTPSEPHKALHSNRMIADAPTAAITKLPRQDAQDIIFHDEEDDRANLPSAIEKAIQEELMPAKAAPVSARARSARQAELPTEERQAILRQELAGSFLLE